MKQLKLDCTIFCPYTLASFLFSINIITPEIALNFTKKIVAYDNNTLFNYIGQTRVLVSGDK